MQRVILVTLAWAPAAKHRIRTGTGKASVELDENTHEKPDLRRCRRVLSGRPAFAETPAAIVEDVQGKVDGIEFMDYVGARQDHQAPTQGEHHARLSSNPAMRETISEGVVLVGAEQSTVQLGNVQRVKVPCDAKAAQLSSARPTRAPRPRSAPCGRTAKGTPATSSRRSTASHR